jgi:hypothetical protein
MRTCSINDIREKIFMLQDKMNMMEMFISHARNNIHEMQELMFEMEDKSIEYLQDREFEHEFAQL